MTPTALHLLGAYGICFALTNDKVPWVCATLRRVPFFDRMLSCPFCTGFHCGWGVWVLEALRRGATPAPVNAVPEVALWAFAGAASCYAVDTAIRWLEAGAGPNGGTG